MIRAGIRDGKPSAPHGLNAVQKWGRSRRHSNRVAFPCYSRPVTSHECGVCLSEYSLAYVLKG